MVDDESKYQACNAAATDEDKRRHKRDDDDDDECVMMRIREEEREETRELETTHIQNELCFFFFIHGRIIIHISAHIWLNAQQSLFPLTRRKTSTILL